MKESIEKKLLSFRQTNKKMLAVLLDPDKISLEEIGNTTRLITQSGAGIILVGGSLMLSAHIDVFVKKIKQNTDLPVILFPGNTVQICDSADAILFLSLISGRNPEYLIGQQVVAAPLLKNTSLEILPTSYLLIDGGKETTASYISHTKPIPADKTGIAVATALAGHMMGHRFLYMDTGSGAHLHVPVNMIAEISKNIPAPLFVGGGIRTAEELEAVFDAGAQIAVVGTAFEHNPDVLKDFIAVLDKYA